MRLSFPHPLLYEVVMSKVPVLCYCSCLGLKSLTRMKGWRYGLYARTSSSCSIRSTGAELTQCVGWLGVCGKVHIISEHSSNTTDVLQHYVFRTGHDLQKEHVHGVMMTEQQGIQHLTTSEPYNSGLRASIALGPNRERLVFQRRKKRFSSTLADLEIRGVSSGESSVALES